jgi:hypothetical protein
MPNFPKAVPRTGSVTQLHADLVANESVAAPTQPKASGPAGLPARSANLARALPMNTTQRDFLARFEASRSSRAAPRELAAAFSTQRMVTPAATPTPARHREAHPLSKAKE